MIAEARRICDQGKYIDNILKLKKASTYNLYFEDSIFCGHGSDLVYMFKISTCSVGSGIDFVKRTQPGGDIQNEWVMLEHVKKSEGVNNPQNSCLRPRLLQGHDNCGLRHASETTEVLEWVWLLMLNILEKHGVTNENFKAQWPILL